MRILVTRPRAQAQAWVRALVDAGASDGLDAVVLPLIEIAPVDDRGPLEQAWRELPGRSFVMFVSANAVEQFFAARPPGAAWPQGLSAGATGPGTAQALAAAGLAEAQIEQPPAHAARFDAEALWARLESLRTDGWHGARVLVVRGEDGRDWLAERWRERGARVDFVVAYKRQCPHWSAVEIGVCEQALSRPQEHLWLLTSSEGIGHLPQLRPQAEWRLSQALATHARIAQVARDLGFGRVIEVKPTVQALVAEAQQVRRSVQSGTS